jgi:hypothetical protein
MRRLYPRHQAQHTCVVQTVLVALAAAPLTVAIVHNSMHVHTKTVCDVVRDCTQVAVYKQHHINRVKCLLTVYSLIFDTHMKLYAQASRSQENIIYTHMYLIV